jgi:hypothetical protein
VPAIGFTKPGHPGEELSFEDAPEWYAEHTEIPAEAIALVGSLEGDPRRRGTNMSPSAACEKVTCIRQLAIKKFVPYLINGISEWAATEGTAWHKAFEDSRPDCLDGFYREVLLPDFFHPSVMADRYPLAQLERSIADVEDNWNTLAQKGYIREIEYVKNVHSSWEIQVFDGIWMNGKVDKLREDMLRIEDFKTKAWGGWQDRKTGQHKIKHYPPGPSDKIQLNLYRRMVEVMTGVNPTELYIRRMYRGARSAREAWKKYRIDVMSNDQLEAQIRPFVERAVKHFTALKQIEDDALAKGDDPGPAILRYIKDLPLDGERLHMFNGHKCPEWCTQMPICFELSGKVRFETKPDETRCKLNLKGIK